MIRKNGRSRPVLALAALIAAISGHGAAAQEAGTAAQFDRLCLKTQGEAVRVALAAATWRRITDTPDVMLRLLGGPFTRVTVWTSAATDDDDGLILAQGDKQQGAVQAGVCTVQGPPDAATAQLARRWAAGAEPQLGSGADPSAGVVYTVIDTAEGRRKPTLAESRDPANGRRISSLVIMPLMDDATSLSLLTFE